MYLPLRSRATLSPLFASPCARALSLSPCVSFSFPSVSSPPPLCPNLPPRAALSLHALRARSELSRAQVLFTALHPLGKFHLPSHRLSLSPALSLSLCVCVSLSLPPSPCPRSARTSRLKRAFSLPSSYSSPPLHPLAPLHPSACPPVSLSLSPSLCLYLEISPFLSASALPEPPIDSGHAHAHS